MQITRQLTAIGNVTGFHANRPLMVKPTIADTFHDGPVRMYKMTDGRLFNADAFDRNFKTTPGKIKPKSYKGSNASKKDAALQ